MRVLTRLDWRGVIRLLPISDPGCREVAPSVDRAQLLEAIHCVTPEGTIHRGARAIRRLSLRIPLLFPLGLLLWFPGVIWIADRVYAWVARNRHSLSKYFGSSGSCKLPTHHESTDDR